MTYRVLRIDEQLYGCEELPEGQPVCCDVLLEDETGERRVIAYPDAELTRLGIDEGDTVRLDHHTLINLGRSLDAQLIFDPPRRDRLER